LVSGAAGFGAAVVRSLLRIAACAYVVIICIRNFLYDKNWVRSYAVTPAGLVTSDRAQVTVPVISVGNITAGGTGKTPMVIWLCNLLRARDINCAILTRGYKAAGGQSDEPALLVKSCPGTTVMINPDRLGGALEAVRKHHAQVIVMDDGFQHRRLHRDIDIVTIDATLPFGHNRILPAGLLREPISALKRAHAAVLTRCDLVSRDNLDDIQNTISRINPETAIAQTVHAPVCAMTAGDKKIPLEKLKTKKIFAFCGIANPDAFLATIGSLSTDLVGSRIYNDHHGYTSRDINEIMQDAEWEGAEMILTTEKDFNKITPSSVSQTDLILAYLAVKLQFVSGQDRLTGLIEHSFAGKIRKK
jgi:tetraacyldisaccharide 4'-kinase